MVFVLINISFFEKKISVLIDILQINTFFNLIKLWQSESGVKIFRDMVDARERKKHKRRKGTEKAFSGAHEED